MNERRYWNSNGEAQALYDEMQAAAFKYCMRYKRRGIQ